MENGPIGRLMNNKSVLGSRRSRRADVFKTPPPPVTVFHNSGKGT